MPHQFIFALGGFSDGFIPTESNRDQWAAHWDTLDFAPFRDDLFFTASRLSYFSNNDTFAAGDAIYIWGFNDAGEWILVSGSDWVWPSTSSPLPNSSIAVVDEDAFAITGQIKGDGFALKTELAPGFADPILSGAEWLDLHFTASEQQEPLISAWGEDPDHDGQANGVEYILGGDPREADAPRGLTRTLVPSGLTQHLALEIDKEPGRVAWFFPEVSADLNIWEDGEVEFEDAAQIVIYDPVVFGAADRRFIRTRLVIP